MKMDKQLQTTFVQIDKHQCLQIVSAREFSIYDHETLQKCTLLPNDSQNMGQTFKVINHKQQKIRFLAVDKCLFFDGEPDFPKCDCILYNDKYFCFIELKEITSHSINTRKQAKKQARKQLISTINKLQSAIRFDDMILEAYVCVGYQANRPAIRASDQNVKLKFETLKTTLFNGCQKCFDDDL